MKSNKKLIYTYLKPQNYYNRLFTFFVFISLVLTFSLTGMTKNYDLFFLKFFVIFFLILSIAVFIEMFYSGEYISPIEIFELEFFFNKFKAINQEEENLFHKYDHKTKGKFETLFVKKKSNYFISSITKKGDVFIITFMDFKLLLRFYFFKFFTKKYIHKATIKKINGNYKIIHLN